MPSSPLMRGPPRRPFVSKVAIFRPVLLSLPQRLLVFFTDRQAHFLPCGVRRCLFDFFSSFLYRVRPCSPSCEFSFRVPILLRQNRARPASPSYLAVSIRRLPRGAARPGEEFAPYLHFFLSHTRKHIFIYYVNHINHINDIYIIRIYMPCVLHA